MNLLVWQVTMEEFAILMHTLILYKQTERVTGECCFYYQKRYHPTKKKDPVFVNAILRNTHSLIDYWKTPNII